MNKDIQILLEVYEATLTEKYEDIKLSSPDELYAAINKIKTLVEGHLDLCYKCKRLVCDDNKNNNMSSQICDDCWNS